MRIRRTRPSLSRRARHASGSRERLRAPAIPRERAPPAAVPDRGKVLLEHYRAHRGQPREPTRPPFGDVELVYMEPTFEARGRKDERALREVFSLKKTPKIWPALPHGGGRPDFALRTIIDAHHKKGPNYLRVAYDTAKHAWAHEVLKNAADTSPIWEHAIADRLGRVSVSKPRVP